MLSILIPIYQENCVQLVNDLIKQANNLHCDYEIIVFDDCSPIKYEENKNITKYPNVKYEELNTNLGRAKIRNHLADYAKGDILLFLDGDSGIVKDDFLKTYLDTIESYDIVRGGTIYCPKSKVPKNYELHWKYGIKVETNIERQGKNMFTTNNFCLRKTVFSKVRFREDIKGYGHEDTFFKFDIDKKNFSFINIDNPVEHLGLKNFQEFISSTDNAVKNLKKLNTLEKEITENIKLIKTYNKLEKLHLTKLYNLFFLITRRLMLSLLATKNPNLFILDLYKLGVYCNC